MQKYPAEPLIDHIREAEELVYKESRLLDAGDYTAWLQLFTEDATYWIPSWLSESQVAEDPHKELSLLHLDRKGMETYVKRIQTGEAHTFNPPSRTTRIISNIVVHDEDGGKQRISGKWVMHLYRARALHTLSGDVEYVLDRKSETLKIARKKVSIINDWLEQGQLIII